MQTLSVIVPALNAAATLARTLAAVARDGLASELIVVDGGSSDDTATIAQAAGARVVRSERGRGAQLATGARAASGGWLLFLHADTVPEAGWADEVRAFIADPQNVDRAAAFRFALDDGSAAATRLEAIVAWRCRALALPYGDQGLLLSRSLYEALGGFRPLPLYEDVDIVRRLGRRRLVMLQTRAVTSAARYRRSGFVLRPLRNLFCLMLYGAGIPPRVIARIYG